MKDDINAVKDSLFRIVDKIVSKTTGLTIRFGIVSYRDHPPQDRTYVTRIFDFTEKIKDVHKVISRLKPSEGGDTPEAVADGLHDARVKLSWDKDAYKVLLLVGDAPPHGNEYNQLGDDYFPNGCPKGYDPRDEVRAMKSDHGDTAFIFVCGCNPLVETSFREISEAVDNGKYYSLSEASQLPQAILKILEGVSDLIADDRRVLQFYEANDGSFDMATAASELNMELRSLKTSLSRLLELGKIARWPKGQPLTSSQMELEIEMSHIPDAIIVGKAFDYVIRVRNPSATLMGIRLVANLITEEDVSEIASEHHDIGPKTDREITFRLVPMTEFKGKASIKVEIFYGSKSISSKIYTTRLY